MLVMIMSLKELAEINFATADPQEMAIEVVATVEKLLGRTLERADPLRIFLRGVEAIIIQQRLLIDETAKQNLLAYATGNNLDHLGALVGCERLPASRAITTAEITLSTIRETSTTIRQGTRFTAGDNVYFALDEDVLILGGMSRATAKASCTEYGEIGNGYAAGELSRIVDPQAFLLKIENITTTEGGADIESDESYRERIHEAPEAYSCAGSEGAYIYHTKSVSQLITDVAVNSDVPGNVRIYPLLKGGELPQSEMLAAIKKYLSAKTLRPLTDNLFVVQPLVAEYELDVTYWVARSDAISAAVIEEKAQQAVADYVEWQREKLGRDINPSELIYRLKKCGVKRVEVNSPEFTVTHKFTVAIPTQLNATFAGLEDD